METKRAAPEKIVFRGTADQLEQAGDYVLILSYLHSRRTGQMLGPLVALFLVCAALLQYQRGDLTWTAVYAILAVLVGAAVMRKTTGEEPVQAVAEDRRSRETARARGSYDGDLPFRIELDRGECRVYFQEEGGDKLYQLFVPHGHRVRRDRVDHREEAVRPAPAQGPAGGRLSRGSAPVAQAIRRCLAAL